MPLMKNSPTPRRPAIPLVLGLILLALVATISTVMLRSSPAPSLTGQTISGQPVGPEQLRGRPYLVNFWATSCVTCVKEMPDLVKVHQEFAARGYQTIAVAMSYDRPDYIETFVRDRGIPFLVIHDTDKSWSSAFGDVNVTPTTFLVDREGKIIKRYVGEPNFPELRRILEKQLS